MNLTLLMTLISVSFLVAPTQELHAFQASPEPLFSFGAIADCQYCDLEGTGRRYSLSEHKLTECVHHLNTLDLAFVVHLGDFIDRNWKSFDVVGPIFDALKAPKYHVLGNHDYSVEDDKKALVPERLGLSNRYYDFACQGFRFVVLDGNDLSFHAYPKDSPEYRKAETYYKVLKTDSPTWNGALGLDQLAWLDQVLGQADAAGERAILFAHFPVYPNNVHNLWNAPQVVNLIETHPSVVAYVNGHNHAGNYGEKEGVHYLTLHGMVDTETTAYSVIQVHADHLEIEGFGRQGKRTLRFRTVD